MKIYQSYGDLIGDTPLVELNSIEKTFNLQCHLLAKVELMNPSGSIKARIAKNMLISALKEHRINNETTIIEPTSGNTGVGLAFMSAIMGLKFIAIMPESMSIERQKIIKAYGGEVVLTSSKEGMKGSIDKAKELANSINNSFIPSQFENLDNPMTHFLTTGPEIFTQTDGLVDIVVSGIGTGGTITGISKYLKSKKNVEIVGIEPYSSPLINKGFSSSHKIQGIGANFLPKVLDLDYIDRVLMVKDEEAFEYARLIAKKEGIFCGISSGAALCGAIKEAKKDCNRGKYIVVILPDSGERYLSTSLVE